MYSNLWRDKLFDLSEILNHSFANRISSKRFKVILEDIFRYIMSNNYQGTTSSWKDKASLVLYLEVLEHQDIIETDLGPCLQDYNWQLIREF